MIGIDRATGRTITGVDQLASRLQQVFTTPKGARNRRRDFGSDVPTLLAHLLNPALVGVAKSYMFDAMLDPANGVTDFAAKKIGIQPTDSGCIVLLDGRWHGQDITVRVPLYELQSDNR